MIAAYCPLCFHIRRRGVVKGWFTTITRPIHPRVAIIVLWRGRFVFIAVVKVIEAFRGCTIHRFYRYMRSDLYSLLSLFIPRPNHPMYVRFNLILFKVHSGCFLRFTRGWSVSRGGKGWLEALNRTRQGQQGTWGLNGLDPDREGMEKYYTIPDDKKRGGPDGRRRDFPSTSPKIRNYD